MMLVFVVGGQGDECCGVVEEEVWFEGGEVVGGEEGDFGWWWHLCVVVWVRVLYGFCSLSDLNVAEGHLAKGRREIEYICPHSQHVLLSDVQNISHVARRDSLTPVSSL